MPPTEQHQNFQVSIPEAHILLVTLTRPQKLNCIDLATSHAIAKAWERLDSDPDLWVGVITGSGRAFCTGADLAEWNALVAAGEVNDMAAPGLAGLPRRTGKKPIIAAVNGIAMGGGLEMLAGCDCIVASRAAVFALPEAKRGIAPVAGSLPRLARTIGLQRTMELALTGRSVDAQTLCDWGFVNRVVEPGTELEAALAMAREMCANSPDSLIVARAGVRHAWDGIGVEEATALLNREWYPGLYKGPNFKEGILAYNEKRAPRWVNSKL